MSRSILVVIAIGTCLLGTGCGGASVKVLAQQQGAGAGTHTFTTHQQEWG